MNEETDIDLIREESVILIVDDMRPNVAVLERMLKIEGYRKLVSTTDAREVADLYLAHRPQLILLDLNMPYLDGYRVMDILKDLTGDALLAVIIITAQNDQDAKLKALDRGASDFITKPFNSQEVMMRIRNTLTMQHLFQQVREYNRHLEERVRERTAEIQSLQEELIMRLMRAAEFRDTDTGSHIRRIGLYARLVARTMGLDDDSADTLGRAAAMHDIGKIGVADSILLKEGALTSDEWQTMKGHTLKGGAILEGSRFKMIQTAEAIALSHHENWDGSGYPRGLKGEEIPLAGRITMVCDVFDALISCRSYKAAWCTEDAASELKKASGVKFDPAVVEAFLSILPEILEIFQQNP